MTGGVAHVWRNRISVSFLLLCNYKLHFLVGKAIEMMKRVYSVIKNNGLVLATEIHRKNKKLIRNMIVLTSVSVLTLNINIECSASRHNSWE